MAWRMELTSKGVNYVNNLFFETKEEAKAAARNAFEGWKEADKWVVFQDNKVEVNAEFIDSTTRATDRLTANAEWVVKTV